MAFVSDTFTDTASTALTSHAGEIGATWAQHPNYTGRTFEIIAGNRARIASGGSGAFGGIYASGSPANAEYDVAALFVRENANDSANYILGRLDSSATTWYRLGFDTWSGDRYVKLSKVVSGTVTLLATAASSLAWTTDSQYTLKLELRNGAKKGYVDGVEVVSSADDAITAAGKAGILANQYFNVSFDNFTAIDAAADTSLSPQGGAHDHTAVSVMLMQEHMLACADTLHSHDGQAVTLGQIHDLIIANAPQTQAADEVALSVAGGLDIVAALSGQTADTVFLLQVHFLALDASFHNHAATGAMTLMDGITAPSPRTLYPAPPPAPLIVEKATTTIVATRS